MYHYLNVVAVWTETEEKKKAVLLAETVLTDQSVLTGQSVGTDRIVIKVTEQIVQTDGTVAVLTDQIMIVQTDGTVAVLTDQIMIAVTGGIVTVATEQNEVTDQIT